MIRVTATRIEYWRARSRTRWHKVVPDSEHPCRGLYQAIIADQACREYIRQCRAGKGGKECTRN